jgi:MoaA/NifB/PqqE/SkfB family radical SAM enzyme
MVPDFKKITIEPTNICTLKCPGCARTRFIEQWPQHWRNHSLDNAALMKFLDIDLSGVEVSLCGNYGDPIYHPDLLGMIQNFKHRGATLNITTNGSHRKAAWWQEIAKELSQDDVVIFSIDGMPDNFTQYRINGDWETIKDAIEICSRVCRTVLRFIPFSFNEQQIDQAKQLSQELGIDQFVINPSERFDTHTMHFKPQAQFTGIKWHSQQNWKKTITVNKVNPECFTGVSTHFISADGHYMPCCHIGDHRFYYKTEFGKNRKQYSITDATFSEILNKKAVAEFYDTLDQQPVCQYNCGE